MKLEFQTLKHYLREYDSLCNGILALLRPVLFLLNSSCLHVEKSGIKPGDQGLVERIGRVCLIHRWVESQASGLEKDHNVSPLFFF